MKVQEKNRIAKIKKDLEDACGIIGWDEKDDFDRALHAKNFIRAYRNADKVDSLDFELIAARVAKNRITTTPLIKLYKSIEIYINTLNTRELKELNGNKEETLEYACYIKDHLMDLLQKIEEEKQRDANLF